MTAIVKERRPTCESQRWLLVQHLQRLDIVKEGDYNGGLLMAATIVDKGAR
jgi:hypothetical protein